MRFYIEKHRLLDHPHPDPFYFTWRVDNPARDGKTVAKSPTRYMTESGARAAVSQARKAFAGAKMATVEVVDTTD